MKRLWVQHPEGVVGFLLLTLVTVVAVGAPLFATSDPLKQDLMARLLAPGSVDPGGPFTFWAQTHSVAISGAASSSDPGFP